MPSQKKKTPTEFPKLNIKVFNTLSRVIYKRLESQKKSTKISPKRIIRTIL